MGSNGVKVQWGLLHSVPMDREEPLVKSAQVNNSFTTVERHTQDLVILHIMYRYVCILYRQYFSSFGVPTLLCVCLGTRACNAASGAANAPQSMSATAPNPIVGGEEGEEGEESWGENEPPTHREQRKTTLSP